MDRMERKKERKKKIARIRQFVSFLCVVIYPLDPRPKKIQKFFSSFDLKRNNFVLSYFISWWLCVCVCSYIPFFFFLSTWGIEESRHLFIACIHSPVFLFTFKLHLPLQHDVIDGCDSLLCLIYISPELFISSLSVERQWEREGKILSSWALHYCRIFGGVCGCADPPLGRPVRRRNNQEEKKNDVTFSLEMTRKREETA
jgi:hypothetical protein